VHPVYPETAARAEAEATVDVLVDLDAEGEVTRVEVMRWAGFGLDDSTVNTIRQMHFRPATRDGVPLPMRVLLRYNFQRPAKEVKDKSKKAQGNAKVKTASLSNSLLRSRPTVAFYLFTFTSAHGAQRCQCGDARGTARSLR
jgi:TonB family protein